MSLIKKDLSISLTLKKYYKNYFAKAISTCDHKIVYHYFNRNDQLRYACLIKKNAYLRTQYYLGSQMNYYWHLRAKKVLDT